MNKDKEVAKTRQIYVGGGKNLPVKLQHKFNEYSKELKSFKISYKMAS
jgi:hypothetical protein